MSEIKGPFTVTRHENKILGTEAVIWGPDGDAIAYVHGNLGLDWDAMDVAEFLASSYTMKEQINQILEKVNGIIERIQNNENL